LQLAAAGASIAPAAFLGWQAKEDAMAKGQMRSNKEKKKPKAEHNKKKKGGPPPSPFAIGPGAGQPTQNPFAKKA
jgi:hypothetical protein